MPLDEKTILALKAQHGEDLAAITLPDETQLVFRKPNRMEYERWFDKRTEQPTKSARELCSTTHVWPEGAFQAAYDKWPAILTSVGGMLDAVTILAGMSAGEAVPPKKL